ncbi:hypothetical protein CLOM_g6800 [Closterium sp. NIES-68]|nr:hypothetical protein CLOM_g6800 [Closterium sp. NIES-68]GJP72335.1 hypothetical protein CLOP_g3077 [Closterium sp. NIES-67]
MAAPWIALPLTLASPHTNSARPSCTRYPRYSHLSISAYSLRVPRILLGSNQQPFLSHLIQAGGIIHHRPISCCCAANVSPASSASSAFRRFAASAAPRDAASALGRSRWGAAVSPSSSAAPSGLPFSAASTSASPATSGSRSAIPSSLSASGGAACASSPSPATSGLPEERATPGGGRHLFCFGLGYVAVALSSVLLTNGWRVSGTCRSKDDWLRLCHMGIQAHLVEEDGSDRALILVDSSLPDLLSASHVLVSIPPLLSPHTPPSQPVDVVLSSCCQHLTLAASNRLRWIGYLSSTGVYGDWGGDWVDEDSVPRPVTPKAVARYAAEREWLAFQAQLGKVVPDATRGQLGEAVSDELMANESRSDADLMKGEDAIAVRVFRLGGIYGPFRSALDTAAAEMGMGEGTAPQSTAMLNPRRSRPGESSHGEGSITSRELSSSWDSSSNRERRQRKRFTSRCHVADICAAIMASMDGRGSSSIINIVDDDTSPRRHVMQFARQLIALGESDLYWQKLEALRLALPPGIIRRGGRGAARGLEEEHKGTLRPTVATGAELMVRSEVEAENVELRNDVTNQVAMLGDDHERDGDSLDVVSRMAYHRSSSSASARSSSSGDGSSRFLEDGEKRVRNNRLKRELLGALKFPSFVDALRTMASGDVYPFD